MSDCPEGSRRGDGAGGVEPVYRKIAASYDASTKRLAWMLGYREAAYRRRAVEALRLAPGDTVVDVGCGTGLNHEMLERAVGPEGRIIGVDLTHAMLELAWQRASDNGWRNVELVHRDALSFRFPDSVDGVLSTFALSFISNCGRVIENGSRALRPGKRWAIADQKIPDRFRSLAIPVFVALCSSFGITREMMERRPWTATRRAMESFLTDIVWTEHYLGFAFVASGRAAASRKREASSVGAARRG